MSLRSSLCSSGVGYGSLARGGGKGVRRISITAVCLAALALCALGASAASAVPITKTYLALGDSFAFGYSQAAYVSGVGSGDPATATDFNEGYVNDYFKKYNNSNFHEVQLTNDGCPGETTASFIGNGYVGSLLSGSYGATTEAPCAYQEIWNATHTNGQGGPLHNPYVGESQLENAVNTIEVEQTAGKPVTTITLDVGFNDVLRQIAECEKAVAEEDSTNGYSEGYPGSTVDYYLTPPEPEMAVKLCLSHYTPARFATITTNVADIIYLLRNAHTLLGGTTINYTGRLILLADYDPYGAVFSTNVELLPGSNTLTGNLTATESTTVTAAGYEACVTNPQPIFNPGGPAEVNRLKKWTNMANSDVHPTKKGYARLSRMMWLGQQTIPTTGSAAFPGC